MIVSVDDGRRTQPFDHRRAQQVVAGTLRVGGGCAHLGLPRSALCRIGFFEGLLVGDRLRLQELLGQGRLKLAGPMPAVDSEDPGEAGFSGSLLVVEFPSMADARRWADADPYIAAGVYRNVEILPFKPVLP